MGRVEAFSLAQYSGKPAQAFEIPKASHQVATTGQAFLFCCYEVFPV